MYGVILAFHVVVCVMLIGTVLLQQGKGADMGAVFGGSSSTVFGSSGAGNFLSRMTTGLAIVFMLTSLGLTYLSTAGVTATIFDSDIPAPPPLEAPEAAAPEAAPEVPAVPEAAAPEAPAAAEAVAPAEEAPAEAPVAEAEEQPAAAPAEAP